MIKTIIIDDEPLAISIVKEYLKDFNQFEVLQECNNGFEGVKAIMHHQPDLIFLDIQMPKINGFEMLELIENPPSVIFTTAFDEYAIKAFEMHAVDYLLKPYGKERFTKAINKWLVNKNNTQQTSAVIEEYQPTHEEINRISVRNGSNIKIIPIDDVLYLEAYDDYVKIHTKEGYSLKKKTLQYFENTLSKNKFLRVHRSFIVQLAQITKIEPSTKDSFVAILKSGHKIPLSKSGYVKLKEVLGI